MLEHIKQTVGHSRLPASWKRNWAYAQGCLPENEIPFLTDGHLVRVRRLVRLTEPKRQRLQEAVAVIREEADLRFLAWLWHCILFRNPDHAGEKTSSWPLPVPSAAIPAFIVDFFPLVVLLSAYEQIEAHYEKIGNIPEHIMVETLSRVDHSMNAYKEKTGNDGLGLAGLNWLLHHFRGNLYSVGRLEYEMKAFGNYVRVYQKEDGEVVALSPPGIRYRSDGHVDGTNDMYDKAGSWEADLIETDQHIIGYPMSADGYALNQRVTLNKSEWSLILTEGEEILNVHIPREGEFTLAACKASFSEAEVFFRTCFPEKRFPAFVCVSWLMDPQLQSLLGEKSNLVRFQKQFVPFPVLSGDQSLFRFVFDREPCPVDELPEKTSLHKKIKAYMQTGGFMHNAGGFILISSD